MDAPPELSAGFEWKGLTVSGEGLPAGRSGAGLNEDRSLFRSQAVQFQGRGGRAGSPPAQRAAEWCPGASVPPDEMKLPGAGPAPSAS